MQTRLTTKFHHIRRSPRLLALPLLALMLPLIAVAGFGQDARERWLSRLASGSEEERLDAAAHLAASLASSLAARFSAASDAPDGDDFPAITALALALRKDSSPVVRALAARALEVCRDPRAAEPLMAALGEEREIAVRKAILYALARHASPQVTALLIPLLKDKQQDVRAAAAFALAEIRDPASTGALLELIRKRRKDDDAFARAQAIRGLGAIGDRTAIDTLLNALKKDESPEVRREAARAIGRIATGQDLKALDALRLAQLSTDPYLTVISTEAITAVSARTP